eukprot:COSAG01_NODE_34456_length_547_cov_1.127232_1_plen_39_part_10
MELLHSGQVDGETEVWCEGWDDWVALRECHELFELLKDV